MPLFRKLFVCPLRVKRGEGKTTISARGVSLFLYLPTKKFDTQSAETEEEEEGKKFFPCCYVLYYSLTRSFIRWTSAAGIRRKDSPCRVFHFFLADLHYHIFDRGKNRNIFSFDNCKQLNVFSVHLTGK